ncbi:hypothetical protein RN001_002095 [Aquatica leii]|uniref:DUF4371 domain-containing protein n=1 Tax=Aquatica leii TaxID=1421715 RepID=A0AAN7SLN4_9COLE|nr:hypothetical protein RN001_002095 [Aquatica leii]
MLWGLENVPLRGHRDDGELSDEIGQGKFRALLHFHSSKKRSYLSKTTQNQLIECCHTIIMKNVINKVKEAKYYAVLADETTDASGKEQLKLNRVGLQVENLIGQSYDEGANMSEKFNGVQTRLKEIQPLAVYMHRSAHKLNLAVVKACSLSNVCNMMGVVGSVTNFVRDLAKRLELIKEAILEKHPKKKSVKLKNLSDTRWLERHDALLQFKELFDSIVLFLKEMDRSSPSSESANLLV